MRGQQVSGQKGHITHSTVYCQSWKSWPGLPPTPLRRACSHAWRGARASGDHRPAADPS